MVYVGRCAVKHSLLIGYRRTLRVLRPVRHILGPRIQTSTLNTYIPARDSFEAEISIFRGCILAKSFGS